MEMVILMETISRWGGSESGMVRWMDRSGEIMNGIDRSENEWDEVWNYFVKNNFIK